MDTDPEFGITSYGYEGDEVDAKAFPRKTPNHGEGLFPRMHIKAGENVLHVRKPLVVVLDPERLADTCATCFGKRSTNALTGEKVKLKRCTGCQKVMYCDKTCQSKNWSFAHKYECNVFRRLTPNWLGARARAMLQIFLRFNNGKVTDGQLNQFFQLTHHWEKVWDKRPGRISEVTDGLDGVNIYSGLPMPKEQLQTMFARLDTNCFTLTTPEGDRIGLFLDSLFASYMNHSCEYNTVVGFDGPEMYAKAIKPIVPDEEILISYIDATSPFEQREQELWDRYFFKCDCRKCAKGTDAREDQFLTSPGPETEAANSNVTSIMTFHPPDKSVPSLRAVIKLVQQTSVWPITRQPYATLRDELIASLLEAKQFQAAFVQATIRYLRIDPILWPMEHHPTRHMHNWVLAKLSIYISQGVDTTHDTVDLRPYEINFGLLVWMLLNKLAGKNGMCSVPSFQQMIEAKYDEVCKEFAAHGLDPASMKAEIKEQWAKMEKVADDGLKMDGEAKETWNNGVLSYS